MTADSLSDTGDQPCEVPLIEQLRSIPKDYRTVRAIQWSEDGRETGHQFIPVGYMMHRAADELEKAARPSIEPIKAEKDEAYRQRNVLVAALARLYPSGIRRTNIEGWSEDWHGCVYIDLPAGQISYHYHDSQAHLFDGLPPYEKPWDGHNKDVVEGRLSLLSHVAAPSGKLLESWKAEELMWHEENDGLRGALNQIAYNEFASGRAEETMRAIAKDALASRSAVSATLTPTQMWERFMDHLAQVEPIGPKETPNVRHGNFLGDAEKYRKIFLAAMDGGTKDKA